MSNLHIGQKAPSFEGANQDEEIIKLSDFLGKRLILYFYPKNNTSGCTAEACNLNDNYGDLTSQGFEVIGVSPDSFTSHQKFIAKHDLAFSLISDPEKKILKAYEAWGEKKMYGKTYEGVLRKTFIIDVKGNIEAIFEKVNTKDHITQILNTLNKKS